MLIINIFINILALYETHHDYFRAKIRNKNKTKNSTDLSLLFTAIHQAQGNLMAKLYLTVLSTAIWGETVKFIWTRQKKCDFLDWICKIATSHCWSCALPILSTVLVSASLAHLSLQSHRITFVLTIRYCTKQISFFSRTADRALEVWDPCVIIRWRWASSFPRNSD